MNATIETNPRPGATETSDSGLNGVNLEAVGKLLNDIGTDRGNAMAGFRVATRWTGGVRSCSTVSQWSLGGMPLAKDHVIEVDEPRELGGTDAAPNPQEVLLTAFNACVMATYIAVATMRGIRVTMIEIESHGELDLHGFLALDETTEPGYSDLHYRVSLRAEADADELRSIHEAVKKQSPNFFNMARAIRLHDELVLG